MIPCLRASAIVLGVVAPAAALFADSKTAETAKSRESVAAKSVLPYSDEICRFVDHVGDGQVDKALALMDKHTRIPIAVADREKLRKQFSAIYGVAGDYDGHEVVTVRRVTKRYHITCVMAYYEKVVVIYRFKMYHFQGRWLISNLTWDRDIEEFEKMAPIEPVVETARSGPASPTRTSAPAQLKRLEFTPTDLRGILDEWERRWFLDTPSRATPRRAHGGII